MNVLFKYIIADKILLISCIGSVLLLVTTIIISAIIYQGLPPFMPLFNQMPWGIARLGTKDQIFIPMCIGLFVLITNSFLANFLYEKIPLLSRILCTTALLICFFIFLFTIRTIQLVL